jgi:hypothetical protein
LQDPAFFLFLLRIDEEFANQTRAAGCACGGVLHSARYPRCVFRPKLDSDSD